MKKLSDKVKFWLQLSAWTFVAGVSLVSAVIITKHQEGAVSLFEKGLCAGLLFATSVFLFYAVFYSLCEKLARKKPTAESTPKI